MLNQDGFIVRLAPAYATKECAAVVTKLQARLSMECWACGFLTPGSEGLQRLDVKHVNRVCPGGWGVTLLHVKGAWELYGRMTGLSAGLDKIHNGPIQISYALLLCRKLLLGPYTSFIRA